MYALIIVAGILILLILFVIGIYNALVRLRNQVDNAWSQIDVQLKRRHDLIPNLVETAKGYMKHERGTFEAITEARSRAMGAKTVSEASKAHPIAEVAVCGGRGLPGPQGKPKFPRSSGRANRNRK